jgi:DNA-binding transcriptional MocR family regulator
MVFHAQHFIMVNKMVLVIQVVAVPGRYFSVRSEDATYKCKFVRMAFANRTTEELQEGARRFASVLDAHSAKMRSRAA